MHVLGSRDDRDDRDDVILERQLTQANVRCAV
jgi:hypothetical protein